MSRLFVLAFAAALLAPPAIVRAQDAAPDAGQRAVQVAVQRDSQRNQQATASVRLPVGSRAWVSAGAGTSRSGEAAAGGRSYRPRQLSAGVGVAGQAWQATLDAAHRRDGSAFAQADWAAAADVRPVEGVSAGVDATHRSARLRNGTAGQRLRGHGVGVHGAVAVGRQLTVHGAVMRSRYRINETSTQPGGASLLGLLQPRPSAVNRDELALARSAQFGATWRFGNQVAVTGEVLQDRLQDGGSLRTAQLKAAVPVGAGWTLAPAIGRSTGPQGSRAIYGQLGAGYVW